MNIYILRERNGERLKRKIQCPRKWPSSLYDHRQDRMGREFSIARWKGMTVTWDKPVKLVRHPKDLTRAHRRGHNTIKRYSGAPENILEHLDSLPRNAPCPYIIRMPFFNEETLPHMPFVKGETWLETGPAHDADPRSFVTGLTLMVKFLDVSDNCCAWRLLWFSWNMPTQVKKSPAYIFAFNHRDVSYDLSKALKVATHMPSRLRT